MLDNISNFFSNGSNLVFAVFAVCTISGAVFMLSYTKMIHMLISLAFTFLSLAGLYVLLEAEFIAFVQVLIYAGAISILMIFGIMMTRHDLDEQPTGNRWQSSLLGVGILVFFGVLVYVIQSSTFPVAEPTGTTADNTAAIGELLYHQFVIPFELLSVLLTVAFIGAIVIAKREGE